MKPKLLVSFSGGETSAYMTWWVWTNWRHLYDIVVVFANTGEENIETLQFVNAFQKWYGIPVVWVEAKVNPVYRKATKHKIVDYFTASQAGEPFKDMVAKYGIPNRAQPHCTRVLKQEPIHSYMKSLGWRNYQTAIGIRTDEIDRMSVKKGRYNLIYPLITHRPMSKPKINFWWSQQPFRLDLKGYQGNCKACWKKSNPKLVAIAKETPEAFRTFNLLEKMYGFYVPPARLALMEARAEKPKLPFTFFNRYRSAQDYLNAEVSQEIIDDSQEYDDYETEACEVFTECGIDN